ncbi:MAG TPA: metalloregulator ArsR/SmtB family transcription factor [Patescibacteria group bacterium]|nr:metalloregulator ArsR/SmtB family transcription factor [Patescibacteria group bacterium]
MDLIQIMKALGDETRLRILNLLSKGALCVCEIEQILSINQSNASRHLNKLTVAGLIKNEKRALYVYYKMNDDTLDEFPFLKDFIYMELNKIEKCKVDLIKLEKYKSSGISCDDLKDGKGCLHY